MKHMIKQTILSMLATALTLSTVTALSTVASAKTDCANDGTNLEVSYKADYRAVTTVPHSSFSEVIIPFKDRSFYANVVFKGNVIESQKLSGSADKRYTYCTEIKNVKASKTPYYFVIDYSSIDVHGWIFYGVAADGNEINTITGGNYYAFEVTKDCDVTIEWDVSNPYTVKAYGSDVRMIDCNIAYTPDDVNIPPTEPFEGETAETTEQFPIFTPGDVNENNRIDIADATMIQEHLVKLTTLSETQLLAADVNNDSYISIHDATAIQKYLAGFIGSL